MLEKHKTQQSETNKKHTKYLEMKAQNKLLQIGATNTHCKHWFFRTWQCLSRTVVSPETLGPEPKQLRNSHKPRRINTSECHRFVKPPPSAPAPENSSRTQSTTTRNKTKHIQLKRSLKPTSNTIPNQPNLLIWVGVASVFQSSLYERTPLGPGKSLGDLRKFRPICLGCAFRKCIFP